MNNKLKKRFIITSTFVSFIILSLILFFVNYYNYQALAYSSELYLNEVIDNEEEIEFEKISSFIKRYENIYIVDYKFKSMSNFKHMHLKEKNMLRRTRNILNMPQSSGVYKNYRFYKDDKKEKLYLINIKMTYPYFYHMMKNSIVILVISMIVVYILSYFLSSYAIRPIIKSNEKQKQFITDASHELKTPLSVIVSNIDLLEYDYEDNKYLYNIKQATNRLNYLINDLLSLARLDENKKKHFEQFNVSLLANEIIEQYENNLKKKNCSLETFIEDDITINANKEECIKLFTILLDNMLKYSTDDSPLTFKLKKKGKRLFIETINESENLEKSSYDEIFERFTRLDSHRNHQDGGNGVGLAILRSIVEKYHGKTRAVSDGQRMVIKVEMPVKEA